MGTSKLYIGNLPFTATDAELSEIFSQCGTVDSARVITERETGRSKGFGFVEMSSQEEAQKAISELNGKDLDGRQLTVNEARPQEPRQSTGYGSGGKKSSSSFKSGGSRGGY
jgi:cold-inducible RNA-binding protein